MDNSGALLLIVMGSRNVYISTTGKMIDYLSDSRIEEILDDVAPKLTDEKYSGAIRAFVKDVQKYIEQGTPAEAKVRQKQRSWLWKVPVAVVVAVAVGVISCGTVKRSYAMSKHADAYKPKVRGDLDVYKRQPFWMHSTR